MRFPVARLLAALLFLFAATAGFGQVSLTTMGTPYTQNFDTLPPSGSTTWTNNSTIPGWFHARTGTGTTVVANDGSSNAGNLYSYGTGANTERALGSLGSGNAAVGNLYWGVRLQNNTGSTITALDVSYFGEQWRNSAAAAQTITFSYLVGSPTVTGSLAEFQSAGVAVAALDFTSPITGGTAGAVNGNLVANRVARTFSITGLSIPNGTEVMLRWSDPDHTGADHGLSIDDFSVTPQGAPALPTLTINDVTQVETNAGTTTFNFTVAITGTSASPVTFDVATAPGTTNPATAGTDYVAAPATGPNGTIPAGTNTSTTVSITVNGDTDIEPNETFFVNITNVVGATNPDGQGLGTITNDDSATLNIGDVAQLETEAGTTSFVFTVSLTQAAGPGGVTFDVNTANGPVPTATAGTDYVAIVGGSGSIAPGGTSTTVTVTVNGDTDFEPSENFHVNISNIVGATPGDVQGLGTILTDDIGLSINDVTQVEGNAGTSIFTFTVSLTSPAEGPGVTFDIATADGSTDPATAGTDYVAKTELARTIAAGNTSATFTVTVNGDTAIEANETFFVNITNVSGAEVTDNQGLGTINNDDFPSFSIADAVITEGNAGTQLLTFTVTLTPAALVPTSVDYATVDDSATAGSGDFVGIPPTTLIFGIGETTKTFDVTINGDTTPEGDEQFFIALTNPTGGTAIGDGQALGIIRMDDARPIPAVDTPVTENFNTLAAQPSGTLLAATTPVGWTFVESGANANATYGADDGGNNAGNTYSHGGDGAPDRAFGGIQSGSLIPTIGVFFRNNTGTTITRLTINYTGEEWRLGTAGRQDRLDFQYSLDATDLTTGTWTDFDTLDFLTPNTVGTGQKDGNNVANRTTLSATITGLSIADGTTFWLRYNDVNASGTDDGLSVDDFSIIANITGGLTIDDVSIVEGNAGTQLLTFTVTRTDPAPIGGTTVDYTTADGTATVADNDYLPTSGTATIPATMTSTTISVTINGDTNQETTENFFVNLSNPVNGVLLDNQGVGTILADDFTFTAINVVQGSGNQSPLNAATVTVRGVVTGIKQGGSGGFFVQTGPGDPLDDANPATSEGIFVFTAGAIPAGVVIGNLVAVTGTVSEFPASANPHTVTELTTASVSLLASGVTLPPPTTITVADGLPTTNLSQYERYEGMRVAATLEVSAPTGGNVDEPNATGSSDGVFYGVIQGVPRPRREPGIPVNDPIPAEAPSPGTIPRFDRNPERIRVSSTSQPGATQLNVAVGQTVSNLVGPLDYGFFEYSILPEAATVPVVTGPSTASPIPTPLATELTVAGFNMFHLYDTVDDGPTSDVQLSPTVYNNRLAKASLGVRNILLNPDVLGVVEAENITVLNDLAAKINADNGGSTNYVAYLVEGNDIGGIDVGYLINQNRVSVTSVTQEGDSATFINPNTMAAETLHDRPPLMLIGSIQRPDATTYNFTVLLVHLRSLNDADQDDAAGRRARAKRAAGAEWVANFVQNRQTVNPNERIIITGDFNAFEFNDGFVDVIGTIKGTPAPANEVVLASPDLVNPNLTNLVDTIAAPERYSYEFGGNLQVLDHAIVNQAALGTVTRAAFGHLDAGFPEIFRGDFSRPERLSDHDAIVAYFDISPVGAFAFSASNYDVGEATTTFNVTVNRTGGSAGPASVSYTVAAGTATAGADFTATSGTLNFAAGQTSLTFPVTIANDLIDEPDQTISLSLNTPTNGATLGAQSTATITIQDDDAAPVLTIADLGVTEGDAGSANANVVVTLTGATEFTVTVDYGTGNDTAVATSDYSVTGGTLTFTPGTTSQSIPVPILGDIVYENSETFFVIISNPVNATIGDNQATVTINNNDPLPTITINDLSVPEGDSGTAQYSLTVTLTGATDLPVDLSWTLDAGTATCCGVDFSGPHGTLTFPVGVTTRTISATIFGDTIDEPDETVLVNLTNAVNATISDNQGVFTIIDDDGQPSLLINDISVAEGNAGTSVATLTVTLAGSSSSTITVDYATANGTATAGSDYTATSGTLTFPPGTTSQPINVTISGDAVFELDETILVNLTNATNAAIGDAQGVITITNDDAAPVITIDDTTIVEGNTTIATVTVTLTGSTAVAATVDYATANNTAVAPGDYTTTNGTLTFAPGETTKTFDVLVNDDTFDEAAETFFVNLTNATNAAISDGQATITITDDDGAPTLSIADRAVAEGNSGINTMTFTVTLAGIPTQQTVTVDYATAANTAAAGIDYLTTTGTLTFAPGVTTQQFNVQLVGDVINEANETFFVNLTNPTNAMIIDAQAIGTINNDDAPPTLAIGDAAVTEGNSGTLNATFNVTLTGSTALPVTVDYATANNTAAAPGDYTTTSGTLIFSPGLTTLPITVPIVGDTVAEATETFFVNLTNPINGTITDNQGLGTIIDNDGAPVLTIGDVSIAEGNAGTTNLQFTVTLAGNTAQTVTVDFATANDTAVAPGDYTVTSGTLTFAPGVFTQTLNVPIVGETAVEANETFFVNLTNATNATIADPQAVGTIIDDDGFGIADLVVTTQTTPNPPTGGQPFTLTITVQNNGPADATGVVLTDQLGPGLNLLSANASQGSCTGNPTVTCNLGTILNGANATVTLTLITNANGGSFANSIAVDSAETDPTPVVSAAPIVVIAAPDSHDIPTLSEWMLIALAMALAAFAALRLRA